MIYTVTFNPAIDYVVEIKDFKQGEVNRVETENKYPGGKGINVSRVLNNLNVKSIVLGFIGGFAGKYIKSFLEKEGIETNFISIKGETRINIKLKSTEETDINSKGPDIEKDDLERLLNKFDNIKDGDFVVLSGNVQNNISRDIYAKIQEKCSDKDIQFVIDTTGEALVSTLCNKPFLIKPNNKEISEIFGVEIKSKEDVIHYGKILLEKGARNVVISMAAEGALLVSKQGIYHASAPKGIVKNSVGAGDSLVGGLIASYSQHFNIVEAFRWGVATGSATAFSMDLCTKKDVEQLINQVIVTKLF